MKIDRNLNLVVTVDGEGGTFFVHSTPISFEVFERYFLTITKTYAAMAENGGEWMLRMGPRTAAMVMKRVAEADGVWSGADGVERGLVAEIRRLTNVIVPLQHGWDTIPYQEAFDKKLISREDASEVENAIAFFIVALASMRAQEGASLVKTVFGMFGAEVTSLDVTAYAHSLTTSTPGEPTGKKAKASSIPV